MLNRIAILSVACAAWHTTFAADEVDFNRDVRPILNQHCIACHGGVKQAAELSFVYEDQALAVIEPGDPDQSYLLDRVTAEDDEERMPPADHGRKLSEEEVGVLRRWIEQGAKWGRHWAYETPQRSAPPAVQDEDWCRMPIDPFILHTLEASELSPAPESSPERWLRRVSLDLIGLPPTPEERLRFLTAMEKSPEAAYANEVDRLLNSVHFGERWASVWLDVIRYADSKGLGQDGRRTVWQFRDWVIRAFNDDLPFDEFTIKQLAGDLLPDAGISDLVATACHRLTQTNEEGGTDDEQFRIEAVIDRVNTTWQAWQGLTFGCVQCHSHPYDPIRHEEYYHFLAYFNNTVDTDLNSDEPLIKVPLSQADEESAAQLDREITNLQEEDWRASHALLTDESLWKPLTGLSARSSNDTRVVVDAHADGDEYHTQGTVSKDTTFTLEAPVPQPLDRLTAIRFTGLPLKPISAVADSEWGFVISHFQAQLITHEHDTPITLNISRVVADEPDPLLDPQLSLNEKSAYGFGAYSRIHHPRRAAFVLAEPVAVPSHAMVRVTLVQKVFELGAFPLVARRGRLDVTGDEAWTSWLTDPGLVAVRQRLMEITEQRSQIKSVTLPIMRERPASIARPTHVFVRGNFLTKGAAVTPATPDFLPSSTNSSGGTRLDLAQWLASEENPLTARLFVNRIWSQMFGTGLVETQEDFGTSGNPPSHPVLLDDLAARFMTEMHWSLKSLLREIALSSTYRQSTEVTPEKLEQDPWNRMLSRGSRHRLPAEIVRDQALAISGLLSLELYGPPVHPPLPEGVWMPFQGSDKWQTPGPDDPDRYRRSVYTYTKRTIPYPMFATFDAPSREFCTPRRLESNTPLQALMTLNDATFAEASAALARRMQSAGEDLQSQLAFGFLAATCRKIQPAELEDLQVLYTTTYEAVQGQMVSDESDSEDRHETARQTALENVASVLLNLDEVLCH